MKKKLCVVLMLVMCMVLAGCGKEAAKVEETVTSEESSVEETTTPESTSEEASTEAAKVEASGDLSDDIYSFQLSMEGQIYQLPMTFETLLSYGWEFDGDASQTLEPNQYTLSEVFKKGDYQIYAQIANFGMDVVPYSECIVASIKFDDYQIKDNKLAIVLPGGIEYLKSTEEEAVAAYGEASDIYEGDLYRKLTYKYEIYQEIALYFDSETKALNSVEVRNLIPMEEESGKSEEVSDEVPEVVGQYVAPTQLGDDFEKFIVELDGALYQVPAPISEFEKNGWKVLEDASDSIVKGKSFGWVTLMKNNQKMKTTVQNYAPNATTIQNTFVTGIKADESGASGAKVSAKVQKGIEIGMKKADLEKALSGVTYESEDSATFIYYEIQSAKSTLDRVTICLNKESGKVEKIEVENQPKSEDLFK